MKIHQLKEICTDGLPVIGRGGTATIYRLDDDKIIKVFFEHIGPEAAMNEQRACRSALKAGLPVVIPFQLAKSGNCYAAVTELVDSVTLAEHLNQCPQDIRKYADMVLGLNDIKVPKTEFVSMKSQYLGMAERIRESVSESEYRCFTGIIEDMPDGDGFVHGDCHAGNVMYRDGGMLLIDLANAGYGHRLFEMAGLYYDYVTVAEVSDPVKYLGSDKKTCSLIWQQYVRAYREKYPDDNWEQTERECRRCADLKGLLLTLPHRELAEAFAPLLRKITDRLMSREQN
jgi:hypothetical protein